MLNTEAVSELRYYSVGLFIPGELAFHPAGFYQASPVCLGSEGKGLGSFACLGIYMVIYVSWSALVTTEKVRKLGHGGALLVSR